MVFLASPHTWHRVHTTAVVSCCENPVNTMKKQKVMTPKVEPPRSVGVQHVTGEEQRAINDSSRKNEGAGPMQK